MKSKIFSLAAVLAFVVMGLTLTSFTADQTATVATEVATNGDCDKCKNAKCDGNCDTKAKHTCTDACAKDGKCTDAKSAEATKEAKSENPEKSAPKAKKACGSKAGCGAKSGCGGHK